MSSSVASSSSLSISMLSPTCVLVRQLTPQGTRESGIYVTLSDKLVKFYGVVLKCGTQVEDVSIGDRVIFSRYAGATIDAYDPDIVIMDVADIQAVLDDEIC
jgi:co-chaperonin GroES (HSP10)